MMCITFFIVASSHIEIVNAASGKNDKMPVTINDDQAFETVIPTSTPITAGMNGNDNTMFTPVSSTVENQGKNSPTVNAPVMAPVAQENADSTENMGEDASILINAMKESCRAVARGIAVTTNTSLQLVYNFDILTTTATPLYTGIAVNNAVTNHLMDLYIKPYCNSTNTNTNKLVRRRQRSLQNSDSSTSSFAYGDVRGIARGTTTVLTDETCYVPVEDTGIVACYRLQTSNTIYFRNDYFQIDNDGLPIVEGTQDKILTDISTAFEDNTIEKNVIKGGETGLQGSSYTSGAVGEVSVQGEKVDRSTESSSKSRGLTRAGKAFLTLFILCFIGVVGFFGYKYGYPKLKEHYPSIKKRLTQARSSNGAATASNTERSFQGEKTFALMTLLERFQRKVPSEVDRPYDFISSGSKLDRNDRNVLISDTMESSSTDGYGTEMILEDLQDEEIRLSPTASTPSSSDYRFTPTTLPDTKEFERKEGRRLTFENVNSVDRQSSESQNFGNNDTFSFSDVNIIIDDSSSYASTAPPNIVPATVPIRRPYSVPDTVNL
jgi:hypothetical protein